MKQPGLAFANAFGVVLVKTFCGPNATTPETPINPYCTIAGEHGYKNVALVGIEGKGHERLAAEVFDYFASLTK